MEKLAPEPPPALVLQPPARGPPAPREPASRWDPGQNRPRALGAPCPEPALSPALGAPSLPRSLLPRDTRMRPQKRSRCQSGASLALKRCCGPHWQPLSTVPAQEPLVHLRPVNRHPAWAARACTAPTPQPCLLNPVLPSIVPQPCPLSPCPLQPCPQPLFPSTPAHNP